MPRPEAQVGTNGADRWEDPGEGVKLTGMVWPTAPTVTLWAGELYPFA